jgi:hypothetical protein
VEAGERRVKISCLSFALRKGPWCSSPSERALSPLQRLFKHREYVPRATAIDEDAADERLLRKCSGRQADAFEFFQSVIPADRANDRASYEPVRYFDL